MEPKSREPESRKTREPKSGEPKTRKRKRMRLDQGRGQLPVFAGCRSRAEGNETPRLSPGNERR